MRVQIGPFLILASLLALASLPLIAGETHWLKNDNLEAGFTWENGIRLASLRVPGGESLFRETCDPNHGLKTWIMAPADDPRTRDLLSEEPAGIEVINTRKVRLGTLQPNPWDLSLEWKVELDANRPMLTIVQRITNNGNQRRFLSIWTIAALSKNSTLRIPFARSDAVFRVFPNNVAVFPYTNLGDDRISSTPKFLQLDIREGGETSSVKLGAVQPEGRVLVLKDDQQVEMAAPYFPDADYPEGGSNVTMYTSPARADTMGEAELMGPLQILLPGDSIELPVRITVTSPMPATDN